jgi:carbon monoxide dehydrogenase subunit G
VPTAKRTRTVPAAPEAVWEVVGDPSHQARWWPKVSRVESVQDAAFTRVYMTAKGRPVRADFRVEEVDPPRTRRWVQVLEGTPFERFLRSAEERATVEPAGEGSTVTLEVTQKLRGLSRFGGGVLFRRATKKQLDEALDALERALPPGR